MVNRKQAPYFVALIALLLVILAVVIGWRIVNGDSSLLRDVQVNESLITPNADGVTDATQISYTLSRNADVSIYFENEAGEIIDRARVGDVISVTATIVVPADRRQD